MHVFVTGGTGFVGSAVVARLVQDGHKVSVLSRHHAAELTTRVAGVSYVAGDLADLPTALAEHLRGVDVVIHCAVSYGAFARQVRINVEGTRALAEAAAAAGVSRFVHISTLAVYGYRISGTTTEDTPLNPALEAYSTTKAAAEQALCAAAAGLEYTIIRPGAIYGPGSSMWTDNMFRWATQPFIIFAGSSSGTVPLIHIDDLVNLILRCAHHPAAKNQVFQAVGPPTTWRAYLQAYASLRGRRRWLGLPVPLVTTIARLIALGDRGRRKLVSLPEMVHFAASQHLFSTAKAHALLEWEPQVTLEKGLASVTPYLRAKGWLNT